MKIGLGQFVCLIAGVAFLSFGAGMIGGRMDARSVQSAPAPAARNAESVIAPQEETSTPEDMNGLEPEPEMPAVAEAPATLPAPTPVETPVKPTEVKPPVKPVEIVQPAEKKPIVNPAPAPKPVAMPREATPPATVSPKESLSPLPFPPGLENVPVQMKEANRPMEPIELGFSAAGVETKIPAEKIVVQVLSTQNRNDATTARNRMIQAGFPSGVFEVNLGEKGIWYRVYVGPFEDESTAQAALQSVKAMPGFESSFMKPL